MRLSKATFHFPVGERGQVLLYNPVTGSIDLAEPHVLAALKRAPQEPLPRDTLDYLEARGHVVDSEDEDDSRIASSYEQFKENEKLVSMRFVIIPTYRCNTRCAYCFQGASHGGQMPLMSTEMVAKAFAAIDHLAAEHADGALRQLSIFGGEPLIDEPEQRRIIELILDNAKRRGLETDFVTNGHDLPSYVDLLKEYGVAQVQVTFDGTEAYHNKRRVAADRKGNSFQRVVAAIDAALGSGLRINARIHLDKNNIQDLPTIAHFFEEKGWNGNDLFFCHIGSVFDCFKCMPPREKSRHFSTDVGNQALSDVLTTDRHAAEVLDLDWHGVGRFLKTGKFFQPAFRTCFGGYRTFAFDVSGGVYICETTAGRPEYEIGRFVPELALNEKAALLKDRNGLSIPACQKCHQLLLCGGGCSFDSYVNHGTLVGPGCRKIKETIGYGLKFYWPTLSALLAEAAEYQAKKTSCNMPREEAKTTSPNCH